jgi:Family of unknown function (DUF6325)
MLGARRVGWTHPARGGSQIVTTRDGVVRDYAPSGHDAWCRPGRRRRRDEILTDEPEPELATDLVEYFVVVLPDRASLAGVAPAVADLVRSGRIRVLDIVVLDRRSDGGLDVLEVGDVEHLVALSALDGDVGLLSENDLALASRAVRPGEVGLVVVAEDRWASQLSTAARRAGGRIVAGERIPVLRVEAVIEDVPGEDPGG